MNLHATITKSTTTEETSAKIIVQIKKELKTRCSRVCNGSD